MRPPYGAVNGFVRQVAAEAGYETILWTQDTRDWAGMPAWYIAQRIKPGVVLMHTQGRSTVSALRQVVPSLLAEGYEFAVY
jgi:peptidoglycan/xylan/chitin deacetylase (PgdA/CDA1 family)